MSRQSLIHDIFGIFTLLDRKEGVKMESNEQGKIIITQVKHRSPPKEKPGGLYLGDFKSSLEGES